MWLEIQRSRNRISRLTRRLCLHSYTAWVLDGYIYVLSVIMKLLCIKRHLLYPPRIHENGQFFSGTRNEFQHVNCVINCWYVGVSAGQPQMRTLWAGTNSGAIYNELLVCWCVRRSASDADTVGGYQQWRHL